MDAAQERHEFVKILHLGHSQAHNAKGITFHHHSPFDTNKNS